MTSTVTGYTAARMKAIEDVAIVDGNIVGDNLILIRHDATTIDAGNVRGPTGPTGAAGGVTLDTEQTITATKTFGKAAAGVGINIIREAASMSGGSLVITRTATDKPTSIVFGNGVGQNFIMGRQESSDHLDMGIDSGGGYVNKFRFGTDGSIIAIGATHLFGAGAIGASGTYLSIGSLGDASNAWVASQGSGTNVGLMVQSKGVGNVSLQGGGGVPFLRGGNVAGVAYLGFYGTTPVIKPAVTGSRGGNAALASLLTALATQGLLTDSSS